MDKNRELENLIKKDVEEVFTSILKKHNFILPISSRSRSGAEISDYLEDNFVLEAGGNTGDGIYNPLGSPKGATKNPYDFCFNYRNKKYNYDDLIWGDIKASKFSYGRSQPDLGTPEKIIKFILDGHFYLLFVLFEYESTDDDKTRFLPYEDGKYVHCMFLKDINSTVRINPKPQFQVDVKEPEEYRTREEFLQMFHEKYSESIERIIKKQMKKKSELDKRFDEMSKRLEEYAKRISDKK